MKWLSLLILLLLPCALFSAPPPQLIINVGNDANDQTGDPIRTAFQKVNINFANTWSMSSDLSGLVDPGTARLNLGAVAKANSVAELLSFSGAALTNGVILLGKSQPGDGGGGTFVWDSQSTAVDDGGGTIAAVPGINPGRWKRVYTGPLDVRWYGAKGDGTNDDTISIQLTINAACRLMNSIDLPSGRYLTSSTLYDTNVSVYGVPDQTRILPQNIHGPALCVLTTNSQPQNYSPKLVLRGLFFDGVNSPGGYGLEVGTNYMGNGAYTANVTIDQCRADNFWNGGCGVHVGNVVACAIVKLSCESNYNGLILNGPAVGTTTSIRDSQFRWSLGVGAIITNFVGSVGPNVIFEANKLGGIQAGLGLGGYLILDGCHFEKNYYPINGTPWLATDRRADVEVFGPDMTSPTYKTLLSTINNHWDNNNQCIWTTNIGQVVWAGNSIYSALPNSVVMRGPYSFLNIEDFPYYQNATNFFVTLESGQSSITYSAQQIDTNQFEYFGEPGTSGMRRLRYYSGNGGWIRPLGVANNPAQGGIYLTSTNAGGHTFLFAHDYNGTPGRFGLIDLTATNYIFDANGTSFTVPALSVVGDLTSHNFTGANATNVWVATGTNWTQIVRGGLVISTTHLP